MQNKELLEKFISDNFNKEEITIKWHKSWVVEIKDKNNDSMVLTTIDPNVISTSINGKKYLDYKLHYHKPSGNLIWIVLN